MKPTDRINEIYKEEYEKLEPTEKGLVNNVPFAELGLRFDAMMKYLDEQYEKENKK